MRGGKDVWRAACGLRCAKGMVTGVLCVVCSEVGVGRVWTCGGPAEVCVLAGGTRCPQPGRGDDVLRVGAQRILGEE